MRTTTIIAALATAAIATATLPVTIPALAQSPSPSSSRAWDQTVFEDGSVVLRSGAILPRGATDIRVAYDVRRAGSGRYNVAVKISYCKKNGICALGVRDARLSPPSGRTFPIAVPGERVPANDPASATP